MTWTPTALSALPDQMLPSDDHRELAMQLEREAHRLAAMLAEGQPLQQPLRYRAYLKRLVSEVTKNLASGDLSTPRKWTDLLEAAARYLRPELMPFDHAVYQMSREVHFLLEILSIADDALESRRLELEIQNRERGDAEVLVLAVLYTNRGTYLRRGQIEHQIPPSVRPSGARIGQLLVRLHDEGLLLRTELTARGSATTSHYALTPEGVSMCKRLRAVDALLPYERQVGISPPRHDIEAHAPVELEEALEEAVEAANANAVFAEY